MSNDNQDEHSSNTHNDKISSSNNRELHFNAASEAIKTNKTEYILLVDILIHTQILQPCYVYLTNKRIVWETIANDHNTNKFVRKWEDNSENININRRNLGENLKTGLNDLKNTKLEDLNYADNNAAKVNVIAPKNLEENINNSIDLKKFNIEREFSDSATFLSLDDIIGCDVSRPKDSTKDVSSYLTIYAYPKSKKKFSKVQSKVRKRIDFVLKFANSKVYEENLKNSDEWRSSLKKLLKIYRNSNIMIFPIDEKTNRNLNIDSNILFDDIMLPKSQKKEDSKKVLILINPFSGPGQALVVFQKRIVPILAEAEFPYHAIVTEYANHAKEIVNKLNLDEWNGIVVVSGDGLMYEVINGLMERSDQSEAIKIPLGALPAGSGNALVCVLLHQAIEQYETNIALHSTFLLVKSQPQPMDLIALDTCDNKRLYSFLSVAWGLVADVDIESERYRRLGNARFTLGALIRIIGLKKYQGRISFLQHNSMITKDHLTHTKIISNNKEIPSTISPSYNQIIIPNMTNLTKPVVDQTKECMINKEMSLEINNEKLIKPNENCQINLNFPSKSLLNPINQPVPSDWVTLEADDFVMVLILNLTHISKDFIAAPKSKIGDGILHMCYIKGDISRKKLIQLMNALEKGYIPPIEDPHIKIIQIKAFRLEPITERGILTVDGEIISYGPLQGQILPSIARILT